MGVLGICVESLNVLVVNSKLGARTDPRARLPGGVEARACANRGEWLTLEEGVTVDVDVPTVEDMLAKRVLVLRRRKMSGRLKCFLARRDEVSGTASLVSVVGTPPTGVSQRPSCSWRDEWADDDASGVCLDLCGLLTGALVEGDAVGLFEEADRLMGGRKLANQRDKNEPSATGASTKCLIEENNDVENKCKKRDGPGLASPVGV